MLSRLSPAVLLPAAIAILAAASPAWGQAVAIGSADVSAQAWRRVDDTPSGTAARSGVRSVAATGADLAETSDVAASRTTPTPRRPLTRVTNGNGTLPNEHGQVWREYDISPYTVRVTTTNRPEQAIVDWILRDTGYEAWHGEPLGVLSANRRSLRVYHTPEMQAVVADLIDRFVSSEAETCTFSLRVITVNHPNWRTRAKPLLRPVAVQTPGTAAWVLQKEDAAVLLAELARRSDYREHSSPHLMVNNGQSAMVSAIRGRSFVRDVTLRSDAWPGFQAEMGQVDEGFSLQFAPLMSIDRKTIDATIKCDIEQVEKMIPVMIDVPTVVAPRQRTRIEVPQITHFRFHERFRWPADQVLLVGMGMVALPVPVDAKPLVPGLPLSLGKSPPRADLLVFVEKRDRIGPSPRTAGTPLREPKSYRGRY